MKELYHYDNKRYPEAIMKSIKMKQSALAEKVGAKSESVISSRMTTKNMGVKCWLKCWIVWGMNWNTLMPYLMMIRPSCL